MKDRPAGRPGRRSISPASPRPPPSARSPAPRRAYAAMVEVRALVRRPGDRRAGRDGGRGRVVPRRARRVSPSWPRSGARRRRRRRRRPAEDAARRRHAERHRPASTPGSPRASPRQARELMLVRGVRASTPPGQLRVRVRTSMATQPPSATTSACWPARSRALSRSCATTAARRTPLGRLVALRPAGARAELVGSAGQGGGAAIGARRATRSHGCRITTSTLDTGATGCGLNRYSCGTTVYSATPS